MATPAELAAVQRLRVDAWTAEVVRAMHAQGIRPVLLKGPSIVRWLYADDPASRTYIDTDLLVSPAETKRAWAILAELGFEQKSHPRLEADEQHARVFRRQRDLAKVDLHRRFHGLQAVPGWQAWHAIATGTDTITVAGAEVEIPSLMVRALLLALHLDPCDGPDSKAWRDLERGLDRVALDDWRRAAGLARELNIEHELGHRLRRVPSGARLADQLELTRRGSAYYRVIGALQRGEESDDVFGIAVLSSLTDNRSRLRYAAGKLWPSDEILRERSAVARRGRPGLVIVHAAHILRVCLRVPRAWAAWSRYKME